MASKAPHSDIIEKIDIGGISLIRAAAKNYADVLVVSTTHQYSDFLNDLKSQNGAFSLEQRKSYASAAFQISSHYDTSIFNFFAEEPNEVLKISNSQKRSLRYGENPHQKGMFFGDFSAVFEQLHGKELSYNNLLDVDAATNLMQEFLNDGPTFAIMKHNNACGLSTRTTIKEAYERALAGDPVSAFGGVVSCNFRIDTKLALELNKIFLEIIIANGFDERALNILKRKKNLRLIDANKFIIEKELKINFLNNATLIQTEDNVKFDKKNFSMVSKIKPNKRQMENLLFAFNICRYVKSNAIVLANDKTTVGIGSGQPSRVDSCQIAINKMKKFINPTGDIIAASDAFFPFVDGIEKLVQSGVNAIIQPYGSINDKEIIKYANDTNTILVFSKTRHFRH